MDMFFIAGTTLITVVWNLNVAVIGFTVLFFVLKKSKPALLQGGMSGEEESEAADGAS